MKKVPAFDVERVENLGAPVGFSFFAEPIPDGKRYLGSPEDVSQIVRDYCGEVAEIAAKIDADATADSVTAGSITADEAIGLLDALAERHVGIFHCREPDAFVGTPFNKPESLGAFVNKRLGMDELPELATWVLFKSCANQILSARHHMLSGDYDEETTRYHIEAAIEDTAHILLGLPPITDFDE